MLQRANSSKPSHVIFAGYVRRSSEMQKDNYSIDAQKRAIRDAAKLRGLPEPTFFEDDERSARGEQIAHRPDFKRLLDYIQANPGKVMVFAHTLDRWSRNVMVTLQSFRILSQSRTAFISLSEHIDYSPPEGMLQLTILAAFAAYFSDMLAKHTSKGKVSASHKDSIMVIFPSDTVRQVQNHHQSLTPKSILVCVSLVNSI